jgi:hypothetical protein
MIDGFGLSGDIVIKLETPKNPTAYVTMNIYIYIYMDKRIYYFDSSEDHIFARVIKFNQVEFEMESGDEIGLSIDLGDMTGVKKCGIHLVDEPNVTGIHLVDEPNVTRTGYWVEPLKYVLVGSEHDQY